MSDKLAQLKQRLYEINALRGAIALLGWDQQTYMPAGGAEDRGMQLSVLSSIAHQKFTDPEVGKLLEDLAPEAAQLDPDSDDACLVRVMQREYNKNTLIPVEKVAEFAQVTALAQEAWVQARANNDFASFRPHLERIVELRREYASYFAPYEHVYDPLLDDFEPGMKTAEVKSIFNKLRPQQVALIKAIAGKENNDNTFLHGKFVEKKQWDFGVDVVTRMGFDWKCGRQDKAIHPFTTGFGIGDIRITTRFDEHYVGSALFSTMHEGGHAMYEQGVGRNLSGLPIATGASMAVHESQSRMWENLVGRSLSFWKFYYPRLRKAFPQQLGNVDLHTFYRGINRVQPSLVRVEADEATYNLHIMLRLELEIALMEGSLAVKDLPEAWNARMQDYLGITPPNDSKGVLQDVHWSGGMIGYFPTYALGNLVASQLWEAILRDIPNLEEQIEQGKFSELLGWLRTKVHVHGAKFEPQVLIQRITGSKIDPAPYMRYLTKKYSDIYGL